MSAQPDKYVKYTPDERFVLGVYRGIDEAIKNELEKYRLEGIISTCKAGCYFCCRQKVPIVIPEAHVLGQYIKRNFSDKQKQELRNRISNWFDWVRDELPKYANTPKDESVAFYNYGPYCPLLVDGKCSIYPARPIACRTCYVSSSPDICRSSTDIKSVPGDTNILLAIPKASHPFQMRIRRGIEASGMSLSDAISLLPQWVAIEMGWEDLLPNDING